MPFEESNSHIELGGVDSVAVPEPAEAGDILAAKGRSAEIKSLVLLGSVEQVAQLMSPTIARSPPAQS